MDLEENLSSLSYRVQANGGSMGGSSYYELPSRGPLDGLQGVTFHAEWDSSPPHLSEIEIAFDYYDEAPLSAQHAFQGGSPLFGTFTLHPELSLGTPVVMFRVPESSLPASVGVAVVDQPIRLVVEESYLC